ncbi:MAG: CaiB/BaiF CoA-transferase family protein [Burkholderiales bacterium]
MAKSPRVADFSTHFSGPVASQRLAHLGADVIKIEHPVIGDGNRQFAPMFHEDSVHHLTLNAGTRSLAIDAKSPQWVPTVAAIARWADVVIVGNQPSSARKLGIDAQSLFAHNDQLVYCMITGWGVAGDWSSLPAHGLNMDALAGAIPLDWATGEPRIPEHYRSAGTTVAGIEAAVGIYAALHRRSLGEGGQVVHVSIWEAALAWQWRDLATLANLDHLWTSYQALGPRYAVYGTKDARALLVCPVEQKFWVAFCEAIGLPSAWALRGDWSGGMDMGAAYESFGERAEIAARMATRERDEWISILREANVPAAPVYDVREAMGSAHAHQNGTMAQYQMRGRTVRVPVAPVSVTPAREARDTDTIAGYHARKAQGIAPAPHLGEQNAEIMRELGLSD